MISNKTIERAEEVLQLLGLSWADLEGKRSLDLGAGSAELVIVAHKQGIKIVALDIKKPNGVSAEIEYVVANARELPFQDGEFDYVLSIGGPIGDMPEIRDMQVSEKSFREAVRVLKTGGELRFGIGHKEFYENVKKFDERIELIFTQKDEKERELYYYKFVK